VLVQNQHTRELISAWKTSHKHTPLYVDSIRSYHKCAPRSENISYDTVLYIHPLQYILLINHRRHYERQIYLILWHKKHVMTMLGWTLKCMAGHHRVYVGTLTVHIMRCTLQRWLGSFNTNYVKVSKQQSLPFSSLHKNNSNKIMSNTVHIDNNYHDDDDAGDHN